MCEEKTKCAVIMVTDSKATPPSPTPRRCSASTRPAMSPSRNRLPGHPEERSRGHFQCGGLPLPRPDERQDQQHSSFADQGPQRCPPAFRLHQQQSLTSKYQSFHFIPSLSVASHEKVFVSSAVSASCQKLCMS